MFFKNYAVRRFIIYWPSMKIYLICTLLHFFYNLIDISAYN